MVENEAVASAGAEGGAGPGEGAHTRRVAAQGADLHMNGAYFRTGSLVWLSIASVESQGCKSVLSMLEYAAPPLIVLSSEA
jgi:hypothetical protein